MARFCMITLLCKHICTRFIYSLVWCKTMWHWYSVPERSEVLTQQIVHWLVCFIVVCPYWCNVLQALLCWRCLIITCLSMICCEGAFLQRHSQCKHFWCKMPLHGCLDPTTESYFSPTYLYFLILRGTQKISFIFNHLRAKNGVLGRNPSQGMFYTGISLHRYLIFHYLTLLPVNITQ